MFTILCRATRRAIKRQIVLRSPGYANYGQRDTVANTPARSVVIRRLGSRPEFVMSEAVNYQESGQREMTVGELRVGEGKIMKVKVARGRARGRKELVAR